MRWILCLSLSVATYANEGLVYAELSSLTAPTFEDFYKLQDYLSHGDRPTLQLMRETESSARAMKIIGRDQDELPEYGDLSVNCAAEERENCLITYASFNKNYPRGLRRLVDYVAHSDFQGHILYRIGGWPDLRGGSLRLAHVPYTFKVAFFQEARRMGFKRVLWLDASMLPVASLNQIFAMIKRHGYFAMGNLHNVGPYLSTEAANAFGITMQQANRIPSCSAGILGVDFTTKIGQEIIDQWYAAAQDEFAFFSARSDQNALSIILHKMGLKLCHMNRLASSQDSIHKKTLFLIDWNYCQ